MPAAPAPPSVTPGDFISGASLIYSVVSGLITILLFLMWQTIREIKTDIKELFGLHRTCRDDLKKDFVQFGEFNNLREEVKEVKEDRKDKWRAFFAHRHNPPGGRIEID